MTHQTKQVVRDQSCTVVMGWPSILLWQGSFKLTEKSKSLKNGWLATEAVPSAMPSRSDASGISSCGHAALRVIITLPKMRTIRPTQEESGWLRLSSSHFLDETFELSADVLAVHDRIAELIFPQQLLLPGGAVPRRLAVDAAAAERPGPQFRLSDSTMTCSD